MSTELEVQQPSRPLTAVEIRSQVNLIQEVMKGVMKKDTHYGTIPGTPKPTLYQPGAEKLLVTFRIAPRAPKVEDLSTEDVIRYRVTREGEAISNGAFLGAGVGECSSDEEKYKWRRPVCDAEFDDTPEDRRRFKYKRDGTKDKQVRTNPADVANTILKMADKRAYVALALKVTAASDIFTQDIEDLPEGMAAVVEPAPSYSMPKPKAEAPKPAAQPVQDAEVVDGDAQEPSEFTFSFVPAAYSTKAGENNGKPWTKHGVKSPVGEWFSSFSDTDGAKMKAAADGKKTLRGTHEVKGEYKTITACEVA